LTGAEVSMIQQCEDEFRRQESTQVHTLSLSFMIIVFL